MTASRARQRSAAATLVLFTTNQKLRHVSAAGCKDLLRAIRMVELQKGMQVLPDLAHCSATSKAAAQASL